MPDLLSIQDVKLYDADRRRAADHLRLVREAQAMRAPRESRSHWIKLVVARALIRIGAQMVSWGSILKRRYGASVAVYPLDRELSSSYEPPR